MDTEKGRKNSGAVLGDGEVVAVQVSKAGENESHPRSGKAAELYRWATPGPSG